MTAPVVTVTRMERRVLDELLRDGPPNGEIGERLHITEDTVKSHIKNILSKTGATNRTQLAVRVFRDQIVVMAPAPRQVAA
jgi:DNA-binding NarL/FixJ family response regulator